MESWPSSPALIALFEHVAPRGPDVSRRRVVGFPATFVNGNLCCGTFNDHFMLRVSDADRAALEALGGTPFEPVPGQAMRSFLAIGAHTSRTRRRRADGSSGRQSSRAPCPRGGERGPHAPAQSPAAPAFSRGRHCHDVRATPSW